MKKIELDKKNICFSKEQILKSKTYEDYKDIVYALIRDDEELTKVEIDERIKKFLDRGNV